MHVVTNTLIAALISFRPATLVSRCGLTATSRPVPTASAAAVPLVLELRALGTIGVAVATSCH